NHMAFFLRLSCQGTDLYPRLRALLAEGRVPAEDRGRFEILRAFGAFVSASSFHFAEYVPYFLRKDRPELVARYVLPIAEYLRRRPGQDEEYAAPRAAPSAGGDGSQAARCSASALYPESDEDAANPIPCPETGTVRRTHANGRTRGVPDRLPADCVVEVPC